MFKKLIPLVIVSTSILSGCDMIEQATVSKEDAVAVVNGKYIGEDADQEHASDNDGEKEHEGEDADQEHASDNDGEKEGEHQDAGQEPAHDANDANELKENAGKAGGN